MFLYHTQTNTVTLEGQKMGRWTNIKKRMTKQSYEGRMGERKTDRQTERKNEKYLTLMLAACPLKRKMDVFTSFASTKTENLTGEKDSFTITNNIRNKPLAVEFS